MDRLRTPARFGLGFLSALAIALAFSLHSFAYTSDDYKTTPEGAYILDNLDRNGVVRVTMKVLYQPEHAGGYDWAEFSCLRGSFPKTDFDSGEVAYCMKFDASSHCTDLSSGEVVLYKFTLEPGQYRFAAPAYGAGLTVLPQSLESPYTEDGYDGSETVEVSEDDEVVIYALYGEEEWKSLAWRELQDYAVAERHEIVKSTPGDFSSISEGDVSKEEREAYESDLAELEEAVSKAAETLDTYKNAADFVDSAFSSTGVVKMQKEPEEKKKSSMVVLLQGLFAVLLLIALVSNSQNDYIGRLIQFVKGRFADHAPNSDEPLATEKDKNEENGGNSEEFGGNKDSENEEDDDL